MVVLGQLQALGAAGRRVNLDLGLGQQLAHNHQVHIVVVHHQDVGVRSLKALPVGLSVADPGAGSQGKHPQLLLVHNVLVQRDNKF